MLPPGRYRNRLPLLLRLLDLEGEDGRRALAEEVQAALRGFDEDPLADLAIRAIVDLLDSDGHDKLLVAGLASSGVQLRTATTDRADRLLAVVRALHKNQSPPLPSAADLRAAPLSLVDDLIDDGTHVDSLAGDHSPWRAHVLARTSPGNLSADDLVAAGHWDELARRQLSDSTLIRPNDPPELTVGRRRLQEVSAGSTIDLLATKGVSAPGAKRLLEGSGAVPPDTLLSDPVVFARLLAESPLEPVEMPQGLSAEQRRFVCLLLLRTASACLRDWDHAGAEARATLVVEHASEARLRAEAHTVIAGARLLAGRTDAVDAAAMATSEAATLVTLNNHATLLADGDPVGYRNRLLNVMAHAPEPTRGQAVVRALGLVGQDGPSRRLRRDLRTYIVECTDIEVFRELAEWFVRHDPDWLARPRSLDGSIFANSPAARVCRAWADDDQNVLEVLAKESRRGNDDDWLAKQCTEWGAAALSGLKANGEGLNLAFAVLDAELPLPAVVETNLKLLVPVLVLDQIGEDDEPSDQVLQWLVDASSCAGSTAVEEDFSTQLADAWGLVATHVAIYRAGLYDELVEMARLMERHLRSTPSWAVDRDKAHHFLELVEEFHRSSEDVLGLVQDRVSGELRGHIGDLRTAIRELVVGCRNLL